jgi:uncharacterized protein YukE
MPALGATIEDLQGLAGQLQTTTGDIGQVRDTTHSQIGGVIDRVRAAGQEAVRTAQSQMDALRTTVDTAQVRADGADWTGANATTFRDGYHDFSAAIGRANQAVTDYFDQLNAALDRLSTDTETSLRDLAASLTDAQASTTSMQQAVQQQADNLDQVMNTGISFG